MPKLFSNIWNYFLIFEIHFLILKDQFLIIENEFLIFENEFQKMILNIKNVF